MPISENFVISYTYMKPASVIQSAGTLFEFPGQAIPFKSEEIWLL